MVNKYSHSHLLRVYTLIEEWQICDTRVIITFSWANVDNSNQFEYNPLGLHVDLRILSD